MSDAEDGDGAVAAHPSAKHIPTTPQRPSFCSENQEPPGKRSDGVAPTEVPRVGVDLRERLAGKHFCLAERLETGASSDRLNGPSSWSVLAVQGAAAAH